MPKGVRGQSRRSETNKDGFHFEGLTLLKTVASEVVFMQT